MGAPDSRFRSHIPHSTLLQLSILPRGYGRYCATNGGYSVISSGSSRKHFRILITGSGSDSGGDMLVISPMNTAASGSAGDDDDDDQEKSAVVV